MINATENAEARRSLRIDEANPLHHLWNNNGTWWVHYTEHLPDFTKRRVRRSLGTRDREEAVRRRDALLSRD
ncbi:MAG: hypothetical protein ACO268_05875 [Opitutales bacterium]|jgi:hypothetical protein